MMIIALCGLAGSGKNAVASILRRQHGFGVIAFADPIYDAVAAITGMHRRELEDRAIKEQVIPWLGKSPRELLQTLGTEWGRQTVRDDIWIQRAMQTAADYERVAICDCRFTNEAEAVLRAGGAVWQVRRRVAGLPGHAGQHASESGIPDRLVSLRIDNNGSLEDLESAVDAAYATLQNDTIKVSPR